MHWVFNIVLTSSIRRFLTLLVLSTVAGCAYTETFHHTIVLTADVETTAVPSADDAADDPAIWIDKEDQTRSLIIGTDKGSGLMAYNLAGEQVQYLPVGRLNNVDLRDLGGKSLLAATQRGPSRIVLFLLDHETREISLVAKNETDLPEPYGICMYQNDVTYVIANGKDGLFIQYEVTADYDLVPKRRWRTETQPEGCVADDRTHRLYYGEELTGIWEISADADADPQPIAFDTVENGELVADVEGLTLYQTKTRTLLVASSQGDNSFAVYDTADRAHLFSFQIGPNESIDGVSETDGIDATSIPLPGYPEGILVVQDGYNLNPREQQNFKLVSWRRISEYLQ